MPVKSSHPRYRRGCQIKFRPCGGCCMLPNALCHVARSLDTRRECDARTSCDATRGRFVTHDFDEQFKCLIIRMAQIIVFIRQHKEREVLSLKPVYVMEKPFRRTIKCRCFFFNYLHLNWSGVYIQRGVRV